MAMFRVSAVVMARPSSWARSIEFNITRGVIMTGCYFCYYRKPASHAMSIMLMMSS